MEVIAKEQLERSHGLGTAWSVVAAEYETEPRERFVSVLEDNPELGKALGCPNPTCGHQEIAGQDQTETRGGVIWMPSASRRRSCAEYRERASRSATIPGGCRCRGRGRAKTSPQSLKGLP